MNIHQAREALLHLDAEKLPDFVVGWKNGELLNYAQVLGISEHDGRPHVGVVLPEAYRADAQVVMTMIDLQDILVVAKMICYDSALDTFMGDNSDGLEVLT